MALKAAENRLLCWILALLKPHRADILQLWKFQAFPFGNTEQNVTLPLLPSQPRNASLSTKLVGHSNGAMYVAIEFFQFICRNPVLQVLLSTNLLYFEPAQVICIYIELGYIAKVAGAFVPSVPVARNLLGVLARQNRVEDGLFRQSRREEFIAGGGNSNPIPLAPRDDIEWSLGISRIGTAHDFCRFLYSAQASSGAVRRGYIAFEWKDLRSSQ